MSQSLKDRFLAACEFNWAKHEMDEYARVYAICEAAAEVIAALEFYASAEGPMEKLGVGEPNREAQLMPAKFGTRANEALARLTAALSASIAQPPASKLQPESHTGPSDKESAGVSDKALQIAAQCWCDPETSDRVMDVELATAFAKRLDNDYVAIAELTERNIRLRAENAELRESVEATLARITKTMAMYHVAVTERNTLRAELSEAKSKIAHRDMALELVRAENAEIKAKLAREFRPAYDTLELVKERDELRAEVERLKLMGLRPSYTALAEENNELRAEVERLKLECQQTEDNLQEAWRVSDAQIKLSAELLKKLDEAQEQQKTWKALAEQYMYQYAKMKPNEQCPLEERTCSRRSRDATRSEGKVSGG